MAVAAHPARLPELAGHCVLRLAGQQLGDRFRYETQVITIEPAAAEAAAADRCRTATPMGEVLLGNL